jgi:3-deoxy-D-manno-octulosonic-acid transferase
MIARALWALLLRLLTPLLLARLAWRARREPAYLHAWPQRLGLGLPAVPPGALWVHAVSLGETRAAAALLQALRARQPGLRVWLTHGTATGHAAGAALLREGDVQTWLPFDTPGAVRRFLRAARPAVGVLMETEVWPTLLHEARRAGVPVVLANARLNARSQRRGQRLSALLRPAAAALSATLAQSDEDAQRLRAAGADPVRVCGNLKFDMEPAPALRARGQAWRDGAPAGGAQRRPVVMAAATREGEEAALLAAWRAAVPPGVAAPLLLVVPRHPQRFDEVARTLADAGMSVRRRSALADPPSADDWAADAWLGDSLGEMPLYYTVADVALLGGSFAPLGGQNLIEALACGCPVVTGSHTFNFAEAARLAAEAGALWSVDGPEAAVTRALALLADPPAQRQAAQAGLALCAAHRGAAARQAAEVHARWPRTAAGTVR